METGLSASTPVAAIESATLPERRLLAGTLGDLAALAARSDMSGPTLILIGRAVAECALSEAEPLAAERILAA